VIVHLILEPRIAGGQGRSRGRAAARDVDADVLAYARRHLLGARAEQDPRPS